VIWAAIALVSAPAQDKVIQYYGFPGSDSCANWTENRKNRLSSNQVLEGWVLGFVTGYNQYGASDGGTTQGGNATAILGWMDQYCAANPLDSVYWASTKLVSELKRRSR
jgi:hypothetical protein